MGAAAARSDAAKEAEILLLRPQLATMFQPLESAKAPYTITTVGVTIQVLGGSSLDAGLPG